MLRFVCGTSILIALISLVVTARAIATGVTGVSVALACLNGV